MDCIVFIHSSVDEHLGFFPTLDYCEQCSPELERLVFPSNVLSLLKPAIIHMGLRSCYRGRVEEWCQKLYGLRYVLFDSLQEKFVGPWVNEFGSWVTWEKLLGCFFFFTQYVFFIVGWQCVNFCCTAKWFNYTYICIFVFKNILFMMVYRVMCVLVVQSCPCDPMSPHGL